MSFTVLAVVSIIIGLLSLLASLRRFRRGRLVAGLGHGTISSVFLLMGALLVAFGLNFYTYDRLTHDRVIAELIFKKIGAKTYKVELRRPDAESRYFTLVGDEWQLFARIVKWKPHANLLGLDSQFRLERISNKYLSASDEKMGERTVYDLHNNPGVDYVAYLKKWKTSWVDAHFGQSVYHPMEDRAHYKIKINQSGLVSYEVNEPARKAVTRWKNRPPAEPQQ